MLFPKWESEEFSKKKRGGGIVSLEADNNSGMKFMMSVDNIFSLSCRILC